MLYLGREDSHTGIRVPVPTEEEAKVIWQKDWVFQELSKKESQARVNSIILDKAHRHKTLRQQ